MLSLAIPAAALRALIIPILALLCLAIGWAFAGGLRTVPMHSALERLALYGLVGVVVVSWMGTVLAALGLFRWWAVLGILAGLAYGVKRLTRRKAIPEQALPQVRRTHGIVLGLALVVFLVAGYLFARPAENLLVYDDSSVYTIHGIWLARHGSLMVQPDPFWQLDAEYGRWFFEANASGMMTRYHGPFYQWLLGGQPLEVGFLPLPKVWLALSTWLFGAAHATWAAPFWGLVGLMALYGIARRLGDPLVGLGAVILLGISLPQIWFARYPISEVFTQGMVLGGLYLAALARQNGPQGPVARLLGFWSGLALGSLTILRYEGLPILAVLCLLLAARWGSKAFARGGFGRTWLVTVVVSSLYGLLVSLSAARYYFFDQSLGIFSPTNVRFALGLLLALGAAGLGLWRIARPSYASLARLCDRFAGWVARGCTILWVVWGAVALWHLLTREWGSSLAGWLVQYWTRPGVLLSVAGTLWLLWKDDRGHNLAELSALAGLASLLLLGYSANPLVTPTHPWAMRRLVPMVLPALAVGAVMPFAEGARRLSWRPRSATWQSRLSWVTCWLAAFSLAPLAFAIGQRSLPILQHQERRGSWAQMEAMAGHFPEGALLLFDNGDISREIPQSAELLFNHPSLAIQHDPGPEEEKRLDGVLSSALDQGRSAYLVITNGSLAWHPARWQLVSSGAFRLEARFILQPIGRPPTASDIVERSLWLDIYEIRPASSRSLPTSLPLEFEAGMGSYPYLRQGFYGWDAGHNGQIARWTNGDGTMALPWPSVDPSAAVDLCLELDIAGGRPADEEPCQLIVEAEGVEVYRATLSRDYAPSKLLIQAHSLRNKGEGDLDIRLRSGTFNAGPYSGGQDQRDLGVLLYRVRAWSADSCASEPTQTHTWGLPGKSSSLLLSRKP